MDSLMTLLAFRTHHKLADAVAPVPYLNRDETIIT